jgi:hypothetical protein
MQHLVGRLHESNSFTLISIAFANSPSMIGHWIQPNRNSAVEPRLLVFVSDERGNGRMQQLPQAGTVRTEMLRRIAFEKYNELHGIGSNRLNGLPAKAAYRGKSTSD